MYTLFFIYTDKKKKKKKKKKRPERNATLLNDKWNED